jgi:sporulation protein YunB
VSATMPFRRRLFYRNNHRFKRPFHFPLPSIRFPSFSLPRRTKISKKPPVKFRFYPSPAFKARKAWIPITIILLFSIFIFLVWAFDRELEPMLRAVAQEEAKKIAQHAFSNGIDEMQKALNGHLHPIATLQKDSQGHIAGVSFNTQTEAAIYKIVSEQLLNELDKTKEYNMKLSLGEIAQSSILSDYGPEIPLKLWIEGSPHVTFSSEIVSRGINTTQVNIYLNADIEVKTLLPITKDQFHLKFNQPLAQQVIVGEVPDFYPIGIDSAKK